MESIDSGRCPIILILANFGAGRRADEIESTPSRLIECARQAGLAPRKQEFVALVRGFCGAQARVLVDGSRRPR
jgi:hypothetical protein